MRISVVRRLFANVIGTAAGGAVVAAAAGMIAVSAIVAGAAAIPEPNAIYYGTVSRGGTPLVPPGRVEVFVGGANPRLVATSTPDASGNYVIEVPVVRLLNGDPLPLGYAPIVAPSVSNPQDVSLTFKAFNGTDSGLCNATAQDPFTLVTDRGLITAKTLDCAATGTGGGRCGDGQLNQPNEECDAGASNGTPSVCCTSSCKIRPSGSCDDNIECTTATCNVIGQCVGVISADGTACTADSNACSQDVCQAGVCKHPPKTNGTSCADNLYCNGQEQCQDGVCIGDDPPCADCDETRDECPGLCTDHPGDCNGSATGTTPPWVTTADVTCGINRLFGVIPRIDACEDCNGSGTLTTADVTCMVQCIFGNCPRP